MSIKYFPKVIENPQVTNKLFAGKIKECFIVEIFDEEYELCDKASRNFWSNSKPGAYGAGLGRTIDDPFKPARTGLLGQMAFGKLFDTSVDVIYRYGGDKQDCLLGDKYKVDIKCAMKNYGKGLIYCRNESGKLILLDKDIYVFSYIDSEDRNLKKATVVMIGFSLRQDIMERANIKPGKAGKKHLNYEMSFDKLRSISGFLEAKNIFFSCLSVL
jgi:hypothetical protein